MTLNRCACEYIRRNNEIFITYTRDPPSLVHETDGYEVYKLGDAFGSLLKKYHMSDFMDHYVSTLKWRTTFRRHSKTSTRETVKEASELEEAYCK